MKNLILTGIFILLVLSSTVTKIFGQDLSFTGYARNYTGLLLNDNSDFAIIQNTFNLNIEQSKDIVAYKVNPYIYQYTNRKLELGLREVYLDIYLNSADIRIGKQQIIWGKADGVFITDIVSPKDLREFLLPDFDEIRMGVNALKLDYYIADNTFELVWIPVFTPTLYPEESSIWQLKPDFPVPPVFDYSKSEVKASFKNSEIFGKFSMLTSLIDLEIMAAYAWDDDPTMHAFKQIDPATHTLTGLKIVPEHHRLTIGGGSFSTTVGPFVLRGEGAYYHGKGFNTLDPKVKDGVVEKDYLHYLIGTDFTIWDVNTSIQFIQQRILDYNNYIKPDEVQNMATFLAATDYLNETLHLRFFMYYDFENKASLIRPTITYDVADGFTALLGANIFTGTEGMFGQFNNNDMIYTKIKYSF